MAIAHQLLLQLKEQLRQPIKPKELVGNVSLQLSDETALCSKLITYYDRDRGVRSIAAAVDNKIKPLIIGKYLEGGGRIDSSQPLEHYVLELNAEGYFEVVREGKEGS